jgi:uncharacterized membrane protein
MINEIKDAVYSSKHITQEETAGARDAVKETARIESFSDGVFAIAITLLVLDIHVPEFKAGETLIQSLYAEWPSILALLIGFFTILICWINHHYMFRMIHRSNSSLLLLNGLKLLVVTLTPFATAVLSKHIQTGWKESAVGIFCFNFALMGIAMSGIWCYANAKGFTNPRSQRIGRVTTRLYIFAGIFSTLIWLVSFFNMIICLALSAIMFCIFISPKRTISWLLKKQDSAI